MYGLKPVPFKLKPVPFKLKPVPFKLKPVPFKLKPVPFKLKPVPFKLKPVPFKLTHYLIRRQAADCSSLEVLILDQAELANAAATVASYRQRLAGQA